jgi:plasmid maintenance system antidote protein VapI
MANRKIHPREVILEEMFCRAFSLDRAPEWLEDIIFDAHPVTEETAEQLGSLFGVDPRFWLNLQRNFEEKSHG